MCGRFTLTDPDADLAVQFNLSEVPDMQPRYNIAPTQQVPVVRATESAGREMVMLRWGLIPFWADDPGIGSRMINARAETAAQKPAFRVAFQRRRCLVVADGFYEWKKTNGAKQPFYVRLRNQRPFAFAGLWERWKGPDETVIESCTLLTTEPNDVVRPIHNRMPVILKAEDYGLWLNTDNDDVQALEAILGPYPGDEMEAYPISRYVNSPENEGEKCIEPVEGQ